MKTKEKRAVIFAESDAPNTKMKTKKQNNYKPKPLKFQPPSKTHKLTEMPFLKMTAFLCDECAAPLHLYGENFIESYTEGRANSLRCLCDLHAEEFGLLEVAE